MKKALKNGLITSSIILGSAALGVGVFAVVRYVLVPYLEGNKHNTSKDAIKIERDYQKNNNFNLIEFPYQEKVFLGSRGLEKLNKVLNERLPFASEVDQLKYIAFNNQNALPASGQVNGQYNPYTMELDIDTRRFIDSGLFVTNQTTDYELNQRVEFVFSVILHEYGHHLANSYITAVNFDDLENYNKQNQPILVPYSGNQFIYKNTSQEFLTKWKAALNYDDTKLAELEKNQLLDGLDSAPVFSTFSSKELFAAANHGMTNDYLKIANSGQSFTSRLNFQNNKNISIKWNASDLANYYYGVDELFTRQLVSLNYLPSQINLLGNSWDSFTPDIILRNNMKIDNNFQYVWDNNQQIFAVDNIFGGLILEKDSTSHEINNNAQKLLSVYQDAIGQGKLISQIFFDNSKNKKGIPDLDANRPNIRKEDFNRIKIGGFIPKHSTIKGLILNFEDNNQQIVKFEHIFQSKNLHGKNRPDATAYSEDNDNYLPYISEEIDLTKIPIDKITSIDVWDDFNRDNQLNSNENKIIEKKDVVTTRPITTFRESLKLKIRTYKESPQRYEDRFAHAGAEVVGANVFKINYDQNNKIKLVKKII